MSKHIKKLFDYNKEVTHIVQVADIHIRLVQRHEEFRLVFDKFYKELEKTPKSTIVVVVGDLTHSKTDVSPEVIKLTSEFLVNTSKIRPTIVTKGNHDMSVSNLHRMDVLHPIMNMISNENLYYMDDTTPVQVGSNLNIYHYPFWVSPSKFIKPTKETGKKNICLFHGPVYKSVTDVGFTITIRHFHSSMFDGFDCVMLGDIHRRQVVQTRDEASNTPIIAYCGSMIQQNFGENVDGHGFLLWNVNDLTYESVDIKNEYSYHTINVEDSVVYNNNISSKNPRIRLRVKNTPQSFIKTLSNTLKAKHKVKHLKVDYIKDDLFNIDDGEELNEQFKKIINGSLRDVDFQTEIIINYIKKKNLEIDEDILTNIKNINIEINNEVKDKNKNVTRNVLWYPKRFEFDNMFSYGEGSVIDFTNMNGLYGLFAPNRSGKSALLDALAFTCFDRTSRTSKANHVLNNTKDEFKSSFIFNHNGVDYEIVREGYKKKLYGKYKNEDHVRVDCKFYKLNEDGEKEDLSGESRPETMEIIQQYLGSYDDFILTTLSLQGSNNMSFIDKTQKERKELLLQFLDLDIFEQLYNIASNLIKDKQAILKELRKDDKSDDYSKSNVRIKELEEEIKNLKDDRVDILDLMLTYEETNNELYRKLKDIQSPSTSLEDLKLLIKDCKKSINLHQKNIKNNEKLLLTNSTKLIKLEEEVNLIDYSTISKQNTLRNDLYIKLTMFKSSLDKLDKQLNLYQEKLDELKVYKFKPDCEFCKGNPISTDINKTNNNISNTLKEIIKVKEKIVEVTKDINLLEHIDKDVENYNKLNDDIQTLKNDNKTLKSEIDIEHLKVKSLEKDVKEYEQQINIWKTYKTDIKNNEILLKQIDDNKELLKGLYKRKDKIDEGITNKSVEKEMNEQIIKKINDQINKMSTLENDIDNYSLYINSVMRDGVPFDIISSILPKIEREVNNILTHIVEFDLNLVLDNKNIDCYIKYDDEKIWPVELGSGMEKFISSLAIRTALINISCLPRPNFLCCDEGFGVLDKDNMTSLYNLFNYMKTQFDFLIIISHLEIMRDLVDTIIEIDKDDVTFLSKINYEE